MNCDPFNDRQGRDGMRSVNASRAALGLPQLHRDEAEDEPVYSVDSVEYGIWAVIAVSLAVIVVGVASALGRYWPAPY